MVIYVDNAVFIGRDKAKVTDLRKKAHLALEAAGLPIHEEVEHSRELETLGLRFGPKGVQSTAKRRWKLRRAIDHVLRKQRMTGSELEHLVGRLTFCLLIRRPLLCVLRSCYTYIKKYYKQERRVWPSVLEELKTAQSLLSFTEAPFSLGWSSEVLVSDSSLSGFAVHHGQWQTKDVETTGAWSDRWRYRRSDKNIGPRDSALQLTPGTKELLTRVEVITLIGR